MATENKVNYDDKVMELIWKVQTKLAAFKTIYLFILKKSIDILFDSHFKKNIYIHTYIYIYINSFDLLRR